MAGVVATASLMEERREQNANREQCGGKKEWVSRREEGGIDIPRRRAPIFPSPLSFTRISILDPKIKNQMRFF